MGLTTVPRNIARLEYMAVRLPLTLLEEHVVARYWDDEAVLRMGFERFLGSLDGLAGRLLADDDLSRRGQALLMRTEYLANADEPDAQAQLRLMRADEELEGERAASRRARDQATAEMDAKLAAAYQQEQEDKRRARRTADAQATVKKARAKQAAEKRAAQAEETKQAEQKRISARQARATAASKRRLSDAADKRKSARERRQEADRPAGSTRTARRSSTSGSPGRGAGSPGRGSGSPARGSGSPARGGQSRRAASS